MAPFSLSLLLEVEVEVLAEASASVAEEEKRAVVRMGIPFLSLGSDDATACRPVANAVNVEEGDNVDDDDEEEEDVGGNEPTKLKLPRDDLRAAAEMPNDRRPRAMEGENDDGSMMLLLPMAAAVPAGSVAVAAR